MKTPENSRHLILLAHGSSDPNWCATFERGLVIINRHLQTPATLAYLEKSAPSLEAVISMRYLRGVREFDVLPLFFAEGRHLLHDVPEMVTALEQKYAGVTVSVLPAVGCQDVFWEALGIVVGNRFEQPSAEEKASSELADQPH